MSWVGNSPINLVMQVILILVTLGFLVRQLKLHEESKVGGAVKQASLLTSIGLIFIAISEFMDLFVLHYEMPYFWVKLYSVTPQMAGLLFVFLGIIGLLRSYNVL